MPAQTPPITRMSSRSFQKESTSEPEARPEEALLERGDEVGGEIGAEKLGRLAFRAHADPPAQPADTFAHRHQAHVFPEAVHDHRAHVAEAVDEAELLRALA